MPVDKLPIAQGINKDTEEVGLATGNVSYLDCLVDDLGVVRRRFGLELLCNVSHRPIDGLAYWPGQDVLIASANAHLYAVAINGGCVEIAGAGVPNAGQAISFVEYSAGQAFVASGGRVIDLSPSGGAVYIADADAPVAVSSIAAIDTYLLANEDGSDRFHWSDVGAPLSWLGEFASAEGKPDTLLTIAENNKLLYLFGAQTVQVFRDDGSTPWAPEYQGYVSRGAAGKNAVILCPYDSKFYFLDNTWQIVRLDGLQVAPVSASINRYLSGFSFISDVRTSYAQVAGRPYVFFHFPTEQKTLVLDVKNQDGYWSEFGRYVDGEYEPFIGAATTVYVDAWGESFVGDRITGNIYRLTHDVHDDAGHLMRFAVRTARLNKGSETRRKRCIALTFRMKKLRNYTGAAPRLMMKYRDNGTEVWTAERTVPLAQQGGEYKATVRALGSYYSRQWEFSCSDSAPVEIASIEEEFEVLR